MKELFITSILVLALVGFSSNEVASDTAIPVVELFTSEGCSSCPAADKLLKKMSDIRTREGKPFIALSFHVTYWNRLGWIDPFSNEVYTERQKLYQTHLNHPQIYTPQAVVNGALEFVGGDSVAFRNTLKSQENRKSSYTISATAMTKGSSVIVQYSIDREPKNTVINIAVVEKHSQRKVTRGENKNRTLEHFNVVREFKSLDLKKADTISLKKPEMASMDNMEIVLYAQHKRTLKIIAASTCTLTN